MDFSGSNVNINFAKVYSASDKVLSAGENSNIKASNITLMNSSVGITSKDSSNVSVRNAIFTDVDVCLTAFNKKTIF